MSENKTVIQQTHVSFTSLLTLVFITLKLLGKIDWSWWWVLSPLWISFAVGMSMVLVGLLLLLVVHMTGRR